jgi:chemotaxis protein MotB
MKKPVVILLSILLAVAVIGSLLIYQQYSDTKEALLGNERKLSDFNEKIAQLEQKNSALRKRVHEGLKHVEELQRARRRISELENSMESHSKEMASSDAMVTEIREQLEKSELYVSQLRGEIEKGESEVESLRSQLSDLRKQNDEATVLMEQIKSKHEKVVSELNQEIRKTDLRVAELESKLKEAKSEANILKDEIKEGERRIQSLEQRISKLFGEKNLLKTQMDQLKSTHGSMLSELKNEVKNKEVTIEELEDKLTITFVDRILFEFGKANISPEGREILTRVGKILKNVKDKKIRVVGHTDNVAIMKEYRHKFPSNWELSAARAAAVVRHFQKEIGIDPENLEAVGHSFYDPVATNETEEGRAQNRRVNIVIAPKIE